MIMRKQKLHRLLIFLYIAIFSALFVRIDARVRQAKKIPPYNAVQLCKNGTSLPIGFSKKHFIISMPTRYIPRQKVIQKPASCEGLLCDADGHIAQALFTPDDNVQKILIDLIGKEHKQIDIAVFSFTNKDIARALLDAHKRGVKIRIVVDRSGVHDRFGKIDMLKAGGIDIFVYKQVKTKSLFSDKMHNKFAVFADNLHHKSIVWTGSFNFTRSAARVNQENVVVLDDQNIVNKFTNQFRQLQQRSIRLAHKKELRTVVM